MKHLHSQVREFNSYLKKLSNNMLKGKKYDLCFIDKLLLNGNII